MVHVLSSPGMADDKPQPKQKTQPKKGKPVEIPVPKRKEFEDVLSAAAKKR